LNSTDLDAFKKGKSAEQLKVIKYFTEQGCCSSIGMMKDAEYLELVHRTRDSLNLRETALEKIGLEEEQVSEIPPVCIQGFKFQRAFVKRGATGRWVSSCYEVTWLFFGSNQLYLFTKQFNLDESKKAEQTQEYFYKDVTSLSTAMETVSSDGSDGIRVMGIEKVEVEVTAFVLTVPGDKLKVAIDPSEVPDHEAIIKAMKHKLREKKM